TDADVALEDTRVVEDDDVRDHEIGRAGGTGEHALAHRLADRLAAAEDGLVPAEAVVALDLDPQVGVGKPHRIADRGPVQPRVAAGVDAHRSPPSKRRPGTRRAPASSTSSTSRETPGSNRTEVPAGTSRRQPAASALSNARAGLLCAKWRWEPTWIGR